MTSQEQIEQVLQTYVDHIRVTESMFSMTVEELVTCQCGELVDDCNDGDHDFQPKHEAEYDMLLEYVEGGYCNIEKGEMPTIADFIKSQALDFTPTGRFLNGQWELTGVTIWLEIGGPSVRLCIDDRSEFATIEATQLGGSAFARGYIPSLAGEIMEYAALSIY